MITKLEGIPLGELPQLLPEARVIYKTPVEFMQKSSRQLITLTKRDQDTFIISFWTWHRDRRFTSAIKGTWHLEDIVLNKKQIHALQRMDIGGL